MERGLRKERPIVILIPSWRDMPYLVSTSFREFLSNISLTGDHRQTAKTRMEKVSELLGKHLTILDIFPTGSLLRGTGLKNVSDVDVVAVLHYSQHIEGKSPHKVLEDVRDVLSDYNAKIVKKNGQAVTLYFETWPNVDIVPAKRVTAGNGYVLYIPDMETGSWIPTDPAAHDRAIAAAPTETRQLIRMVKRWNEAHSHYLQSFHIEQIALSCLRDNGPITLREEDDWPLAVYQFFKKAIEMTEATTVISRSYSTEDWVELRNRLDRASVTASDGWTYIYTDKDSKAAIERFRVLFGDEFPAYG